MAEITPPYIESIADSGPHPQDQPAPKRHAKSDGVGKSTPSDPPKIEPAEEDKHQLDEMA